MLDNDNVKYLLKKREEIINNCPKCHGTKPFCECSYKFRLEIRKASANIPIMYRDFTLDKLTHPQLQTQKNEIARFVKNALDGHQTDLIISGATGLAKSSIGCYILTELLRIGKTGLYFPSIRSVMDFLASKLKDNTQEKDTNLCAYDTIIIDGIGYGFIRERTQMFDYLLDQLHVRKTYNKHTILISGVPKQQLDGADKDLIQVFNPVEIALSGFDYVKEVIEAANPEKAKKIKKLSGLSERQKLSPTQNALLAKKAKSGKRKSTRGK